MKTKYIKEFNLTGNSIVDVDKICKDWNDKFSISTFNYDGVVSYTIQIFGKRGDRIVKSQISEEQAKQIIDNLGLIHVQAGVPRNAGSYGTKEFIQAEIERFEAFKAEKENEIIIINKLILNYKASIDD